VAVGVGVTRLLSLPGLDPLVAINAKPTTAIHSKSVQRSFENMMSLPSPQSNQKVAEGRYAGRHGAISTTYGMFSVVNSV